MHTRAVGSVEHLEPQSPSLLLLALHRIAKRRLIPVRGQESSSEGQGERGMGTSTFFRCPHFTARVSEMCWSSGDQEMLVAHSVTKGAPQPCAPLLPVFSAALGLSLPLLFRSSVAFGEPPEDLS